MLILGVPLFRGYYSIFREAENHIGIAASVGSTKTILARSSKPIARIAATIPTWWIWVVASVVIYIPLLLAVMIPYCNYKTTTDALVEPVFNDYDAVWHWKRDKDEYYR
jgi:hypothetical protein